MALVNRLYASPECRSLVIFFSKQRTAYEMRSSAWSSDVCSSDVRAIAHEFGIIARGSIERIERALEETRGDARAHVHARIEQFRRKRRRPRRHRVEARPQPIEPPVDHRRLDRKSVG